MKTQHQSFVVEKVWGPDDTYLTVTIQVRGDQYKKGDAVIVTVEKKDENDSSDS